MTGTSTTAQRHYYGREGCIIRSRFLGNIRDAYEANPDLIFLGSDSYFKGILENALSDWRKVVAKSNRSGHSNAMYGIWRLRS